MVTRIYKRKNACSNTVSYTHLELSKINYRIHTDAIKQNLIPAEVTRAQASIIYANEADVLDVYKRQEQFGNTGPDIRISPYNERCGILLQHTRHRFGSLLYPLDVYKRQSLPHPITFLYLFPFSLLCFYTYINRNRKNYRRKAVSYTHLSELDVILLAYDLPHTLFCLDFSGI